MILWVPFQCFNVDSIFKSKHYPDPSSHMWELDLACGQCVAFSGEKLTSAPLCVVQTALERIPSSVPLKTMLIENHRQKQGSQGDEGSRNHAMEGAVAPKADVSHDSSALLPWLSQLVPNLPDKTLDPTVLQAL